MKRLIVLLLIALLTVSVSAQSGSRGIVNADSAFARVVPDFDAEPSASLYEDEQVEIVGRNLNGLWFLVRRPARLNTLGWMFHELLDYDVLPETLPLMDISTGVVGPTPLTEIPPFGGYLLAEAILRDSPSRNGARLRTVPVLQTIPITARNNDASWLKVNYLGYEGWVSGFVIRRLPNMMDIPEAQGIPQSELPPVVVVPIEIQQAQIDRLRAFATDHRAYAFNLELFWWSVFRGEIMPCSAPAEITDYPYTVQDVVELPELGRYAPQLHDATTYLNTSRDALLVCGVVRPDDVYSARNSAINAKVIYDAALQRLDVLEDEINRRRPRRTATPAP
jgi:hypothetical protein